MIRFCIRFLIALPIISAAASRLCRGSPGESCFGFAPWCYGGPFRTYKARHSRESIHTGTAFRVIEVVLKVSLELVLGVIYIETSLLIDIRFMNMYEFIRQIWLLRQYLLAQGLGGSGCDCHTKVVALGIALYVYVFWLVLPCFFMSQLN